MQQARIPSTNLKTNLEYRLGMINRYGNITHLIQRMIFDHYSLSEIIRFGQDRNVVRPRALPIFYFQYETTGKQLVVCPLLI